MVRRKAEAANTEAVTEMTAKADEKEAKDLKELEKMPEAKKAEVLYSVAELAENAEKIFPTKPECVYGAFKAAGRREATVQQAKSLVKEFLKKAIN